MNSDIGKWNFPTTFPGGGLGFNDGGTQLFKDDDIESLAREVCQNSIDAKRKNLNNPVIVEFNIFKIKKFDFPGYDDFKKIIIDEINNSKKIYKNNMASLKYYQDALDTLNAEEILCLRISDFNTTGLTNSGNKNNNNWANLVVFSGTNDKNPEDGGSFGLGKNAMYTCSKFGCLFFSTLSVDKVMISEGVAKLSYYSREDNEVVHGLGFYGDYSSSDLHEEDKPLQRMCNLDKKFHRKENDYGTDVYVLGFEQSENDLVVKNDGLSNFDCKIMASIIDNYFVSIVNNMLVVRINEKEINNSNIYDMFEKIYQRDSSYFNENTMDYLNVMKCSKVYPICIMEKGVPDAELRIELNSEYHNRVAMIKNTGMKIMDKNRLPQIAIFSGILILKTNEVNGYFKQMENPAHNDWVLSRIRSDKKAYDRYQSMLRQIKDILKELANESIPSQMDIAGLGEFLPDDFDDNVDVNKKENITDELVEKLEVKERIMLPKKYSNIDGAEDEIGISNEGEIDDDGEYESSYSEGVLNLSTGGFGSSHSSHQGDGKVNISKIMDIGLKRRCYFDNILKEYVLSLYFPNDVKGCKLHIKLRGEQGEYSSKVVYAYIPRSILGKKNLSVENDFINIGNIASGEKILVCFRLDHSDNYALEVDVYENKK